MRTELNVDNVQKVLVSYCLGALFAKYILLNNSSITNKPLDMKQYYEGSRR
jgi:hypothetical protein